VPIYEFICHNCGAEFERLVSFSDNSSVNCPSCQGTQVQRQLGLPAIHFKGSGWYITDSKKADGKKPDTSGESSAGDSSGETSDAKSQGDQDAKSSEKSDTNTSDSASSSNTQPNTDTTVKKQT